MPPLADIIRYGEARKTETEERLAGLLERLIVEGFDRACLTRRAISRHARPPQRFMSALRKADEAIRLVEPGEDVLRCLAQWPGGPCSIPRASRALIAGCAAHLLYEAGAPFRRKPRPTFWQDACHRERLSAMP